MTKYTEADTSRFVHVKDTELDHKIHYNDIGEGPAVVMMHGSGPGASGWSNFHRNVDAFVEAGYRVLLVDSPGWNKSDPILTQKREQCNAQAVKGVLDALNIERASLIGNSMGGASALRYAMDYPDRIDRLVVMGGSIGGGSLTTPMPTEGIKRLFGLYKEPTLENLRAMLNIFVYDPSRLTEDLIQGRWDNMMRHEIHLKNFVASASIGRRTDHTARMSEVKAPTLVTWGRDDRFVPLDLGLKLLWGLPDANLHVFSKCGHWAQWEHTEQFNDLVLGFFKR